MEICLLSSLRAQFLQSFILVDNFLVGVTYKYLKEAQLSPTEYTSSYFFAAFHLGMGVWVGLGYNLWPLNAVSSGTSCDRC